MPHFKYAIAQTDYPVSSLTGDFTGNNGTYPPYVYGLICTGAWLLVILAVILVALILHRVHLRLLHITDSNLSERGEIPTSHSEPPPPPPPPLDNCNDIPTLPEDTQENSLQNGRAEDTDIITTCNEAYGVAPDVSSGRSLQTRDSLERNDAYDYIMGGWLERDIGTNVEGIQVLEDDGPDYENLVSPDHLFGDYVQPEFATTPSSSEVLCTIGSVVYSEVGNYPCSGNMATSRSLPNIIDHCEERDKHALRKQKNCQKVDQVKITLHLSTDTLI